MLVNKAFSKESTTQYRDVQLLLINHEKCNHDFNYIILIM